MSTDNHSCLRFSLEESIWFQRGQEVAELISISLDPDITIQENDQYVTIKGSLELSGEYTCRNEEEGEELEPQFAARQVQSVLEGEEGQNEFLHRFPVDITIPQNRIESMFDIDIQVESFDYDIPSRNCLKLTAELAITGLYGEQQHAGEDGIVQDADVPPQPILDTESVFEEQRVDLESQSTDPQSETDPAINREPQAEVTDKQSSYEEVEPVEVEIPSFKEFNVPLKEESPPQETNQEPDSLYEPFKAEAKKEPVEKEIEPVLSRNAQELPENESTPVVETARKEGPQSPAPEAQPIELEPLPVETEAVMEDDLVPEGPIIHEKAQQEIEYDESSSSSSSSESEESPKQKKFSKKKGLSIAEFLARKEDTELTTLRVCIVQQDETIGQIAERYDISVQQLLNLNQLSLDQDVSEGQVLYVPAEYVEKR